MIKILPLLAITIFLAVLLQPLCQQLRMNGWVRLWWIFHLTDFREGAMQVSCCPHAFFVVFKVMLLKGKEIDFTNAPILLISLLIIVMIEWKEDEGQ